ncbi:MAG: primosomal protein N', partial [Bacillota bacterium]
KSLVVVESLFDRKLLSLFQWISNYYHSYLVRVIKTAIPTGVSSGKVGKKSKSCIRLKCGREQARQQLENMEKRAPKQAEVIRTLLKNPETDFTVTELAARADCYQGAVYRLLEKDLLESYNIIKQRRPFRQAGDRERQKPTPTSAQTNSIEQITRDIANRGGNTFLLHGVTGSGKTEVYLNIIEMVLEDGGGAIVLVPEISLTPIMVRRFYSRFGEQIAILHSRLSLGERYDEWRRLKRGRARIAIGARSAVFAPVKDLRVIIIDEEHENSYKQTEYPHYHARQVARKRAELNKASLVLGSATPSLESSYRAACDDYRYLSLPDRVYQEELPPVSIIDMREQLKQGNTSIFSTPLDQAIREALKQGEQVLLFLNRRGYSNFMLCRECGHVLKCQNCDISLTYHHQSGKLRCHYCDYSRNPPRTCPECGSRYLRDFGIGTERLQEEARKQYPGARVGRMDVDTTTRKGSHRKILEQLERGELDILVGTQMIAKGHDYPNISVVGVITADTVLNLPDFRSSERTFQLLTQVAGRTGRGEDRGRVIIQTYNPEHYSIQAARNHDYRQFYQRGIKLRRELNYPPFTRLANIIIKGQHREPVAGTARELGRFLHQLGNYRELLGPSPAPIEKLRGDYRWQVILKFDSLENRDRILTEINRGFIKNIGQQVNLNIDVDPLTML